MVLATVLAASVAFSSQALAQNSGPELGEPKKKAQGNKTKLKTAEGRVLVDRVVAVINDEVILHSELMRRVVPLAAEIAEITDRREQTRRMAKL